MSGEGQGNKGELMQISSEARLEHSQPLIQDRQKKDLWQQWNSIPGFHVHRSPPRESTKTSFESLLANKSGLTAFRAFLMAEFSEENIAFYLACEEYRRTKSSATLPAKAKSIYDEFIGGDAPKEVNIDHETRGVTKSNLEQPTLSCFDLAQDKIYTLMEKDSYPRFLRSLAYCGRIRGLGQVCSVRPGLPIKVRGWSQRDATYRPSITVPRHASVRLPQYQDLFKTKGNRPLWNAKKTRS
ncbi:hypothetical protein AAFF_G00136410 [Aldrovandia affinis]|uniref:RGS domain-containing protein n=1 Tax=Aldrovandia affinis TaxID=143900 RepID=A0AAD7RQ49_9TELE|nr:hypothetical protein AAFF_G00136410 [Aldrovandia affinis]